MRLQGSCSKSVFTPNAVGVGGLTALFMAASHGQERMAKLLLEHGADPNIKTSADGTPLHISARKGHTAVVGLLLAHGADPNIRTRFGWTPLMRAVDRDDLASIKRLLDHGADVNLKNYDGKSALAYARLHRREVVASLLKSHGAIDFEALAKAQQQAQSKAVEQQQKKAAIQRLDPSGRDAAFLEALKQRKLADMEALLETGADIEARNDKSDTGLMLAARMPDGTAELDLLLAHGADANARNQHGWTALMLAP